jgi:hypothetical protein
MLPMLSLLSWRIAFAKLIGVLAVVARLERGSLGKSGTFLHPFAIGLKTLSSKLLLKSKIALFVFSNGSFSESAEKLVDGSFTVNKNDKQTKYRIFLENTHII